MGTDVTVPGDGANAPLLAGRYRVIRQLGHGGMGSVWLAEDIQLDGKLFAVKMLPSILTSDALKPDPSPMGPLENPFAPLTVSAMAGRGLRPRRKMEQVGLVNGATDGASNDR